MFKHTQPIRWQFAERVWVFDHVVGLALKELQPFFEWMNIVGC